jgi:hypothetical protein
MFELYPLNIYKLFIIKNIKLLLIILNYRIVQLNTNNSLFNIRT